MSNEAWLRCDVSPGMFDFELGVDGRQFDGTVYSLFAPKETVDHDQPLSREHIVPGWVRVKAWERKDNLVLVELPRETFQNGAFITVTEDQLETRPQRQQA